MHTALMHSAGSADYSGTDIVWTVPLKLVPLAQDVFLPCLNC